MTSNTLIGKTVLASSVSDEVLQRTSPNVAVAYFYCDYKDLATQEPQKVLGSLVQQIARQDEQSLARIQRFHELHAQDRKTNVEYDCQDLCNLIVEVSNDYDCTMIVVNGLDECGVHAGQMTEFLVSLNNDKEGANIKFIFLSRDELDIPNCLNDYHTIPIAAESSDLRLYVDTETNSRTRKRKLNIKAPGLKEHVRDQ